MATLDDLKTRIADELTRDDMGAGGDSEGALTRAINSAVDFYADEPFWFSHLSATTNTVPGSNSAALPTGMRIATQVSYLEEPLIHDALERLQPLTERGIPSRWAMDGDNLYLWPQPDAAYTLSVQGYEDFGSDTWPNAHYDLVAARAKIILCRFPFRDDAGEAAATREEADALARIRRESRKRRQRPLRADFAAYRYNINTDR